MYKKAQKSPQQKPVLSLEDSSNFRDKSKRSKQTGRIV